MDLRFRVALVATVVTLFLTLHLLVYQNGYVSIESIQKLFGTCTSWPWKAGPVADDEYLIGVGKADITGYVNNKLSADYGIDSE